MNAICQAIQVKWLAATSHKPARLKAISKGGTLTQSVCSLENESMNPHMSLDIPAQHLAEKLAALAFFTNLTMRMRLDRVDGVGELVLAGDDVAVAAVEGFVHCVDLGFKPRLSQLKCLG